MNGRRKALVVDLRRTRGFGIALLLIAAIAAGCGGKTPVAASRSTARRPLTTVRVNFTPSISSAPLAIAKEEGDFEREGIAPSLDVLDMNSAMVALIHGDLDVYGGPIRAGVFNLVLKGVSIQVVADKGHSEPGPCVSEALVAPAALAERLKKSGDYRGTRFSFTSGSVGNYLVDRLLEQHHTSRDTVEFVHAPHGGDFLDAGRHALEAVRYLTEPNLTSGLAKGNIKILQTSEEIVPGNQLAVLIYGPRLLRTDPDLGRRFMRAYLRGVRRYNEGKTKRNVEIIARYTRLPPELVTKMCWEPIASNGQVQLDAIDDFIRWSEANHYLDAAVPRSAWWNPSFIEAAFPKK